MAATLVERANWALAVNPPIGHRHLTTNGSNWLWAVTAVFIVALLVHAVLLLRPLHGERIFHYIFTIALLAGSIAYFSMASGLGSHEVATSTGDREWLSYQVFWPKYAFWAVAFPAVILALGLLSGITWATIVFEWALAWFWIFSYYMSARTRTDYKWGFFAFGTAAYLLLAAFTLTHQRASARRLAIGGHYTALAGWVNLLWLLYPIAFGLSDGGNEIGVTGAFIFFGILDLLMVPVLSFAFVALARRWDYGRLNLHFTRYGRVAGQPGVYPEKAGAAAPAPAAAGARV
jgi:bacteriorhodopsin